MMSLKSVLSILHQNENRFYLVRLAFYTIKLGFRKQKFNWRHAAAVVLGRIAYKRIIPHMMLEVCSPCQHRCTFCAHSELIRIDPSYQMSLEEVKKFLLFSKRSRYYIENLWINGPGEPTLWRWFNEGVKLIYESGIVVQIHLTTNGQSLERVNRETWSRFSHVSLSIYPSSRKREFCDLRAKGKIHGFILRERSQDHFRVFPERSYPDSLPAKCVCPGPMIYGSTVYYYCGPTGFGAAKLMGETLSGNARYCGELRMNYLEGIDTDRLYGVEDSKLISNLELCQFCWANLTIELPSTTHVQLGAERRLANVRSPFNPRG